MIALWGLVALAGGATASPPSADHGTMVKAAEEKAAESRKVRYHIGYGQDRVFEQIFGFGKDQRLLLLDSELKWTREGYTFLGWATDIVSGIIRYADGQVLKGSVAGQQASIDLYCVWSSPSAYKVVYHRNESDADPEKFVQRAWRGSPLNLAWKQSQLGWQAQPGPFLGWASSKASKEIAWKNGERVWDLAAAGKQIDLYAVYGDGTRGAGTPVVRDRGPVGINVVSVAFLLFVTGAFMAYFLTPFRFRSWALLLASLFFYALFGWKAIVFICASALSIYLGALALERRRFRGLTVALVIGVNIGLLALVKYGSRLLVEHSFVLPLGISFYTLQAVSYCVDVYRGVIPAERNPAKILLYLVFFPTIMQGPISRYGQLAAQLWTPHRLDLERTHSGLALALWGFFKKTVIADRAAFLSDNVFASGSSIEGFAAVLGVLCYSIQIYADFSGCVDICRGISETLGIDLIQNFKHPYFSVSIKDFWRRWHISLSSWLKDYVYIPLGGNRHGAIRKYLNVVIVFAVSGVWHGVGLNFLIWGLLHGLYQVFDGLTAGIRAKVLDRCHVSRDTFSFVLGQRVMTFVLVTFAWIFFRAATFADACSVIRRLFVFNPWTWTDGSYLKHGLDAKDVDVLCISVCALLVVSMLQERGSVREMLRRQTLWFRWTVYLLGLFGTLVFGVYGPGYNAAKFIYMQF